MPNFRGFEVAYPSGGTGAFIDPNSTAINIIDPTAQLLAPGTPGLAADGRKFRYGQNGATLLVPGNILQAAAPIANHQQIAVAAAQNIGDTQITVTLGATAATANQYAGGWVTITTTPGNGYAYKIKSHPAAALSANLVLTLAPDDPIVVALTTSSVASLTPHPYVGVIQAPTTLTGACVGGCVSAMPASNWGWIQTQGLFPGLIHGTPAVGNPLTPSLTTAGALDALSTTAATLATQQVVAVSMVVGVTATNCPVFLTID